jgi:putative phosphoesterase
MLIGVFSDVHDNLRNLRAAMKTFKDRGIDQLVFCGDFCSPIPAREMATFGGLIHCVFGNGDGDPFSITRISEEHPNLKLYGQHAEIEVSGHKFAVTHYPLYGRALARTGDYRAVFSGHTHVLHEERFGGCLWLNPGEVMGWKGRATCAVYDLSEHAATIVDLDPA